ncbi:multicopper oxidase family protein [Lysinibacillus sp. BF-4]|uniref:multicopper oxidase family protein n=1 Tax=Lysinibacillus sp. BF-4 TaxID=1473546 RepID=UPI000AE7E1A6|nr:multicopper oxidase domain-containing protein [Lysinibacillus sp. BF-4]
MDMNKTNTLHSSTGSNAMAVPPLLVANSDGNYELTAMEGTHEFYEGIVSNTLGYNGALLGPTLRLQPNENVTILTHNAMTIPTTFHWHGLVVDDTIDGGPQAIVKPGETRVLNFTVAQPAATLWLHPHPHHQTARQVYNGLASLVYIEDNLNLPSIYGQNDFPVILQDRLFNEGQLDYDFAYNSDGTKGDMVLINGTVNPTLHVSQELVRLRLVNGSNARNYTLTLSTGDSFLQIATDGGFLPQPTPLTSLTLSPAERAEIIIDFSDYSQDTMIALCDSEAVLLPFTIAEYKHTHHLPKILPSCSITAQELALPVTKTFELYGMADMAQINGKQFDATRIDCTQIQGITEVWEIYNKTDEMGGMIHPFHVHDTQFKVLTRNGMPPAENERGYKDTIAVAVEERVRIAVRFMYKGIYMYHCHILEHEDNGMMGQIQVI